MRILTFVTLIIGLLFLSSFSREYPRTGKIIVYEDALEQILDADEKIEVLADGFEWTEGPLWLPGEDKLIFSDIFKNSIFEWTEANGVQLYLQPSGYTGKTTRAGELGSNALLLDSSGKLVICQHGDRRVARMEALLDSPEASFQTIASSYKGHRLNSPNDAVFRGNGDLYFTDPPYGLEGKMEDPAKGLDFQGVYKVSQEGQIQLLTRDLTRPNGIAFSPDQSKLYVANSDEERAVWMVFDVTNEGTLNNGKVFYDVTELAQTEVGLPDGMEMHPDGYLFASGPGGIFVFSEEGKVLGKIITGQETSNCAFDDDFSTLYITADDYIMRLRLKK